MSKQEADHFLFRNSPPPKFGQPQTIREIKQGIIDLLIRFGQKEVWDLATQLGVDQAVIAQALQELLAEGKIRIVWGDLSNKYCCVALALKTE